ncbi:MAG: hypothetical protein OQK77_11840 [Psychromonas sp.]|nr:hypothetical protein [Psychromonas sp.]
MPRSYRAPGYPIIPGIALLLSVICLITMIWFNLMIFTIFVIMMLCGYSYFLMTKSQRQTAQKEMVLNTK